MTMGDPNATPPQPSPTVASQEKFPDSRANDNARYTKQQEREMAVTDDKGVTIQPSGAFMMMGWAYVFAAAVAIVIIIIAMRLFGGGESASPAGPPV